MSTSVPSQPDASQLRLRWRGDLIVSRRTSRGKLGYLVEDPITGQFHRLGEREFHLAESLNGRQTIQELAPQFAKVFQPAELQTLVRWLIAQGLVEVFDLSNNLLSKPAAKPTKVWDPFFLRCTLWRSPPIFDHLLPATRWLFAQHTVFFVTLASLWLAVQLSVRWEQVTASATGVFLPQQHVQFFVIWLLLKLLHELAHGIVCRKYGGEVREVGLSFIFGMPTPYVDVTTAWRFPERWQRMATSLAGMYVEWLVAMLAATLWLLVEEPSLRICCVQVFILVGLGTLAFNANPLMRFDGYYVLIDLLDHPNLANESQQFGTELWRRVGWGMPAAKMYSWPTTLSLATYGTAAWMWRMLTLATLAWAAVSVYEGVGIALVSLAACLWFGRGVLRNVQALQETLATTPIKLLRPVGLVASAGGLLFAAATYLPWPLAPQAVGVIRNVQEIVLRTDSAGIIRELCVRDGDEVTAGQLLARLQNDELELQHRHTTTAHAAAELKARQLQQERKLVEWRAEIERQQGLRMQLADLEQKIAALEIRSPIDGVFFARRWQDWLDRFVPAGEALAVVAQPTAKEVKVAVPHASLPLFSQALPRPVQVVTSGGGAIAGELIAIESQARREPLDSSLTVNSGGSLAVREVKQPDGLGTSWELLEPHFTATVRLPPDAPTPHYSGQRCRVKLQAGSPTIATHLYSVFQKWQQQFQTRG